MIKLEDLDFEVQSMGRGWVKVSDGVVEARVKLSELESGLFECEDQLDVYMLLERIRDK